MIRISMESSLARKFIISTVKHFPPVLLETVFRIIVPE